MSEKWEAAVKAWPILRGMPTEQVEKFLLLIEKDVNVYGEIEELAYKYERK